MVNCLLPPLKGFESSLFSEARNVLVLDGADSDTPSPVPPVVVRAVCSALGKVILNVQVLMLVGSGRLLPRCSPE